MLEKEDSLQKSGISFFKVEWLFFFVSPLRPAASFVWCRRPVCADILIWTEGSHCLNSSSVFLHRGDSHYCQLVGFVAQFYFIGFLFCSPCDCRNCLSFSSDFRSVFNLAKPFRFQSSCHGFLLIHGYALFFQTTRGKERTDFRGNRRLSGWGNKRRLDDFATGFFDTPGTNWIVLFPCFNFLFSSRRDCATRYTQIHGSTDRFGYNPPGKLAIESLLCPLQLLISTFDRFWSSERKKKSVAVVLFFSCGIFTGRWKVIKWL